MEEKKKKNQEKTGRAVGGEYSPPITHRPSDKYKVRARDVRINIGVPTYYTRQYEMSAGGPKSCRIYINGRASRASALYRVYLNRANTVAIRHG